MSSSINIYPFENTEGLVRFGVQTAIFVIGVLIAHHFIIKPALKLQEERKKRTSGRESAAKDDLAKAHALETQYEASLLQGTNEAKRLGAQEIQKAQDEANAIIAKANANSNAHLAEVKARLAEENQKAKQGLPEHVDEIVKAIFNKMGVSLLLLFAFATALSSKVTLASGAALEETDFWYGIFWPYFQFVVFILGAIYVGKKPILEMLSNKRDDLRARLSEAVESSQAAQQKVKEYEQKIASLNQEISDLKTQLLEEAHHERVRILAEANDLAESIMIDARRAASEMIHSGQEALRKELLGLAITKIEAVLTPEKKMALEKQFKSDLLEGSKSTAFN